LVAVREFMKSRVAKVDEDEAVETASRMMGRRRIGSLVVTREGRPYAIFTERDLLSKVIARGRSMKRTRVGDVASSPLIAVRPETNVREAAKMMRQMRVRRLAVVEEGRLMGIFTSSDLADAVAEHPLDI